MPILPNKEMRARLATEIAEEEFNRTHCINEPRCENAPIQESETVESSRLCQECLDAGWTMDATGENVVMPQPEKPGYNYFMGHPYKYDCQYHGNHCDS
jgi:hypothetical protein